MDQIIVYEQDFGNNCMEVVIIVPVDKSKPMDYYVQKSVPPNHVYFITDRSNIPENPLFRHAWVLDSTGVIVHDIERAKEIWRGFWRAVRASLLKDLDVKVMRAMEEGDSDTQKSLVEQKKELRDVTTTDLSTVTTIDELQAVWPECLGQQPDKLKPFAYKKYLNKNVKL